MVERLIDDLLRAGVAETRWDAAEMFLDDHLHDLAQLLTSLPDAALAEHAAIKLLMSHGSGGDQSPARHAGFEPFPAAP
jgi:hypothetical protein